MFQVVMFLLIAQPVQAWQVHNWQQYGGPRRDFISKAAWSGTEWSVVWRQPIGPGTSAVVGNGKYCFTMAIKLKEDTKVEGEEIVSARDLSTGKVIWEQCLPIRRLKGQESFSGEPIRPQATPALHRGCLCTLGYTGLLTGWEASAGRKLWQIDLVKDLGSTPVQFGFAASPLIYQDDFIVHAGGKQTVLIRVDALTGRVKWKSEPGQPSYASPIVATLAGQEHVVQVTRDAIMGFDPDTGKTFWKYAMPEQGLTNVPTPLAVAGDKLLVSGQGIQGTRLLQYTRKANQWDIQEVWHNNKVTFFYCNWQIVGDAIYGNANKILLALHLKDGRELWRERGYSECNLLRLGDEHLILDGDGKLSRCKLTPSGVEKVSTSRLLKTRCWTAPSILGQFVLIRDQDEVMALRYSQ